MKIALIGYGQMGRAIEEIAILRGHQIVCKITSSNLEYWDSEEFLNADVAIEFTRPDAAVANILKCIDRKIPVIVGTTAWLEQLPKVEKYCKENNGTMLYASNFSIGVNIFFAINKKLASLMNGYPEYEASIEEIHHIKKLDAPSGTAITLAEGILENLDRKSIWTKGITESENELKIISVRTGEVPGTHTIKYESDIDIIEITHKAKNRKGFATGSVVAAEWIIGKRGVHSIQDMLQF
jgi:4-hydroxy-tetrahydrodipicolinate reductase